MSWLLGDWIHQGLDPILCDEFFLDFVMWIDIFPELIEGVNDKYSPLFLGFFVVI